MNNRTNEYHMSNIKNREDRWSSDVKELSKSSGTNEVYVFFVVVFPCISILTVAGFHFRAILGKVPKRYLFVTFIAFERLSPAPGSD